MGVGEVRRGAKIGIVGGLLTAMVGAAGYGTYNLYQGVSGGNSGGTTVAKALPTVTGPPTAAEVRNTARDFLAAWAKGDETAAGALTNDPATAAAELTAYRQKAHVTSLKLTPGVPGGAEATKVPFKVAATLTYDGKRSPWSYDGSLTVFRGATTHKPLVDWHPSVLNPKLGEGESLETGKASKPQVELVDRNGKALDATAYPSLAPVLTDLRQRYATKVQGGTPGIETWIDAGDGTAGETLHVLTKGKPAKLRTTLDAGVQAAAEKAVKQRSNAGVVALKASTGQILAVANNPAGGTNLALGATVAPGSTFKVVTAATLLEKGVTPGQSVPCKQNDNYNNGKMFHNVEKSQNLSATFAWDFENSCNTGFISLAGKLSESSVPTVAHDVFGFGQTWNVGVGAFDGKVPGGSGDEMTSEMIGQGQIQMSPLNMASVAATARTGLFHQPVIVAPSLIGEPIAKAGRALSPNADASLRSLMRLTAQQGTATTAMRGLTGTYLGAKTGSAEAGTEQPNGWFLAYRDDVAASGVVLQGGHGGDSAGPIVADVLKAARG